MTMHVDTPPQRRAYGSGIIEKYGDRLRVRVRKPDGTKPTLGIRDTPEDAGRLLDAFFEAAARSGGWKTGSTLRTMGSGFLDDRETLEKCKSIKTDRSRWENWILAAEFADWPLSEITDVVIRDWVTWLLRQRVKDLRFGTRRKPRNMSPGSAKHCLDLLRVALEKARLAKQIEGNPAEGITVPGLDEPDWDWMTLSDQQAWESAEGIPPFLRYAVMFAYGAGQRRQDQWDLTLDDIHIDAPQPYMTFKMRKRKVSKRPKWVTVPLFGAALRALQAWLPLLPTYCKDNPRRLVWPARDGGRRVTGVKEWNEYRAAAGIKRHIKWHELRHTFGSSLVSGIWGKPWSLQAVRDVMGHSSVNTTERYAHLAPAAVFAEGSATNGPNLAQALPASNAETTEKQGRATQESNLRPSASEAIRGASDLASIDPRLVQSWADLAQRYMRAVNSRNRYALRYGDELAGAVVGSDLVRLAQDVLNGEKRTYTRATQLAAMVLGLAGATQSATRRAARGGGR